MAFTSAIVERDATGKGLITGTYASSAGGTGGAIATGLNVVEHFSTSSPLAADTTVVGGAVTITTGANSVGTWQAYGY